MKARTVTYERLKSLPGFNHQKIGITIELESTESASDAMKYAKRFVDHQLGDFQYTIQNAEDEIPF